MKNRYEIRGEETLIYALYKGKEIPTRISTSDLSKVKAFPGRWGAKANRRGDNFYINGKHNYKTYSLHRWVVDAPKELMVDHVDNDTLNNTRGNLRIVTCAQNNQNRKGATIANRSSGIRGVSWFKITKKWRAKVQLNGKTYHLGYYEDLEEAEKVVVKARKQLLPFSTEK